MLIVVFFHDVCVSLAELLYIVARWGFVNREKWVSGLPFERLLHSFLPLVHIVWPKFSAEGNFWSHFCQGGKFKVL